MKRSRSVVLLLVAALAAAVGLGCFQPAKLICPTPRRECASWSKLDAGSKQPFALICCSGLDPASWDTARTVGKPECAVGGLRFEGKREPGGELDSFAELRSDVDPSRPLITLRPEPRVTESMGGSGAQPAIACDTERARFYLGSAFLGYVVAYRPNGQELWRIELPEFRTVIGRAPEDNTVRGLSNLIESDGSILCKLSSMGSFIAIAYRVKGRWQQLVVHRSGVPVAKLGPWDGVLVDATADGWLFDAGGESAYGDWKLPTEEMIVRFTTSGPELLIDHFLTYNLPRPQDASWTWRRCDADNRFGRLELGSRFDRDLDEIARKIHDGLGSDWAERISRDEKMTPDVLIRGERSYQEWKTIVRNALLDAGADVDCMKYARDHGLWKSLQVY